tara:strand:- start:2156 stop:3022 length:867 start_codon:yes stop_codon:yes gene_type:complete
MGIVTAILNALKKAFKGKPATVSELKKTMTSLGLDDPKIMDEVIAAYKAEETASLSKAKDLVAKGDVPEELAKPVVQTFDDSIKKFADEIGGDVDEVKGAIANYVNEGYEAGSYKRVDPDSAESIANIIDINTNYGKSSKINFIDDISEQINTDKAFSRVDNMSDDALIAESGIPSGMKTQAEANPSKFLQDMFNVEPTKVQKIADSTLAEIQAMDAQLKNLIEEGKFTEADALAERLKDFRNQLNAGDLDAAVIPPDRTLNANGGLIPPRSGPMSNGIGQMFKRKIS